MERRKARFASWLRAFARRLRPEEGVDVTQLDIEVADGERVFRPWIGVMMDGYSRRILRTAIGETRQSVEQALGRPETKS